MHAARPLRERLFEFNLITFWPSLRRQLRNINGGDQIERFREYREHKFSI